MYITFALLFAQIFQDIQKKLEHPDEFKFFLILESPESQWLVGFKTPADKTSWTKVLLDTMHPDKTTPDSDFSFSSGSRQGSYEFREKGKYTGAWYNRYPHGAGKLDTEEMIYEGYWHSELRCGFGKVTDKVKTKTFRAGWSFRDDKPEVAEGLWSNEVSVKIL